MSVLVGFTWQSITIRNEENMELMQDWTPLDMTLFLYMRVRLPGTKALCFILEFKLGDDRMSEYRIAGCPDVWELCENGELDFAPRDPRRSPHGL